MIGPDREFAFGEIVKAFRERTLDTLGTFVDEPNVWHRGEARNYLKLRLELEALGWFLSQPDAREACRRFEVYLPHLRDEWPVAIAEIDESAARMLALSDAKRVCSPLHHGIAMLDKAAKDWRSES
jgi:hypothetical protein